MTTANKISANSAVQAYKKVFQATKNSSPQEAFKLAEQTTKILRSGDNLEVKRGASNDNSFAAVAKNIATEQVKSIKMPEPVVKKAFTPTEDGQAIGTSNIELLRTFNEANTTLMLIQEMRSQFIAAFQDIIKTPL